MRGWLGHVAEAGALALFVVAIGLWSVGLGGL